MGGILHLGRTAHQLEVGIRTSLLVDLGRVTIHYSRRFIAQFNNVSTNGIALWNKIFADWQPWGKRGVWPEMEDRALTDRSPRGVIVRRPSVIMIRRVGSVGRGIPPLPDILAEAPGITTVSDPMMGNLCERWPFRLSKGIERGRCRDENLPPKEMCLAYDFGRSLPATFRRD